MRQFAYYTENCTEKLKKPDPCKVNLWMHKTKIISLPPSKTSLPSYTSILILEESNSASLFFPIFCLFADIAIKPFDN